MFRREQDRHTKRRVWQVVARVLRSCGCVAVLGLAIPKPLPQGVRESLEVIVVCHGGAEPVVGMRATVLAAGLADLGWTGESQSTEAVRNCENQLFEKIVTLLPGDAAMSDSVVSLGIAAEEDA